ncbi:MAG: hypothetical protein ACRDRS_03485 [Pseudonocardiaceae bacterium]
MTGSGSFGCLVWGSGWVRARRATDPPWFIPRVEHGERAASPSFVAAIARALTVNVADITEQPHCAHKWRSSACAGRSSSRGARIDAVAVAVDELATVALSMGYASGN